MHNESTLFFTVVMIRFFFFCFLFPAAIFAVGISYTVTFEGLSDASALRTIKSISQLTSLKKRPPASINALRYRAEADIPDIIKALYAYGYLEASVHIRMEEEMDQIEVIVSINPGPIYQLEEFKIDLIGESPDEKVSCEKVERSQIGIELGKPAKARRIIEAEQKLLHLLAECGYPLAHIDNREIIADGQSKTIRVRLDVKTGPLVCFGETEIRGLTSIKPKFVERKINWEEGEQYDSRLVDTTQSTLIDSGLFTSLLITHAPEVDSKGELPMNMEMAESKHKSVHIGASYQTTFGPGISFGWENRNIDGMGSKFSLQGDVTKKIHSGLATLQMPDFWKIGQTYIWQAQAMHEDIRAYSERSYSLLNRFEKKIGKRLRFGLAGKLEKLYVTSSVDNGIFTLLQAPVYLRWSSANDLLNPTKGVTIEYLATPALNLEGNKKGYLVQKLTQSTYWPLMQNHRIVLAQKITLGLILSDRLSDVPVSKRFFGGSEEDLRGYPYFTVSPLKHRDKPKGGRSALFYTLETRFRISRSLGLVPFFDMGNVYLTPLPTFKDRWFKAVGIGVRYFSYIGPLRIDIGFPLERRPDLDKNYRILVSIGQMF